MTSPFEKRSEQAQRKLFFAVQTRFHRDSEGNVRADHAYARFDAWKNYLGALDEVVLVARVSGEVRDEGVLVEGPGVSVLPVPYYRGFRDLLFTLPKLRRFISQNLTDAGALYGARVPDVIGIIIQRRARQLGAKFFAQVVGDPELVLKGGALGIGGIVLARAFRVFVAREVARADGVIYVTRVTLQKKYPPSRSAVIATRSNVEIKLSDVVSSARDYTQNPIVGTARLFTAGSQEQHYKGHDILIDAAEVLHRRGANVEVVIGGGGKHHQLFVEQVQNKQLETVVTLTGHLPSAAAVREETLRADIFVLPSRTEGLSRVLIEAMATGTLCIGSAVGGTPELLPAEALFEVENPEAIADTVQALLAHPETMTKVAAETLETAREIATSYSGSAVLKDFIERLQASDTGMTR